jgi:hypothetical protein
MNQPLPDEERAQSPQRYVQPWLKWLLGLLAGIVGGALGIVTGFYWMFLLQQWQSQNPAASLGYLAAFAIAPVTGAFGAIAGGWLLDRGFDWYEGVPPRPRFRDRKSGGDVVRFVRFLIWAFLLLMLLVIWILFFK